MAEIKTQRGVCPQCGSENILYNDDYNNEEFFYLFFYCLKCGFNGKEIFKIEYLKTEKQRI